MTLLKLRKTMTLPNVIELKEDVMTIEFDSIQHAADVQLNAVAATLPFFGAILQAIVAEGTDYTKKSMDKHKAQQF